MVAGIFTWWFHRVFAPVVREQMWMNGMSEESRVLVLDNCCCYPPSPPQSSLMGNVCMFSFWSDKFDSVNGADVQNLKMLYCCQFMRKPMSRETRIQEFQSKYSMKDAIFNVSCAWNKVKLCEDARENCSPLTYLT
jgi:hypothetical protein